MVLILVTIWDDRKSYFDLVKLSQRIDLNKYQIVFMGLTKKQFEDLPKGIIGIKRTVSVKELDGIYSEDDLYLNLLYSENYPIVNIETMSCDTHVLTYDTGGSTEIIEKYGGSIEKKGDLHNVLKQIENVDKNHRYDIC